MTHREEGERGHIETLFALDEAEDDLEAGRYTDHTAETLPNRGGELKREARAARGQA